MSVRKRKKPSKQEQAMGLLSPTGQVSAQALDYFVNQMARTGFGTPSLLEATQYQLVRFSYNYWDLITLYRNHFLCRKIVDAVAEDMTRAWPTIKTEMEQDDLSRVNRAVRRTNSKSSLLTGLKWSRLFGGAGCLMIIEGQEDKLSEPLDLESVEVGSFKGLIPFDMWSGISPSGTVCDDINRPLDFNKPEHYTVRGGGGESFDVHCSRILRFLGPEVPTPEREASQYWGISVLEPPFEVIRMFDNILFSVVNLTYRANLLGKIGRAHV